VPLFSQNPHGAEFKIDCAACHSSGGWELAPEFWVRGELVIPKGQKTLKGETRSFNHARQTEFPLTGQHAAVDCRACHQSLAFAEAQTECISCHTDLHQVTAGADCTRCHTTENWLVDNITELHQDNGFPLVGNHAVVSCTDCHTSESVLRFDRIGNECTVCHLDEYMATTIPSHVEAGYSTDCLYCHDPASPSWLWAAGVGNHSFFPLTKGHDTNDCVQCHTTGTFSGTPTDCIACHEADYQATTDPGHVAGNFPTDCNVCHTTGPGWPASDFTQHDDAYFPVFSGKHNGEWSECNECHTTPGDFKAFSCTVCHEHSDAGKLASEHDGVSDYSFSSQACYNCHPKGDE
jgi:Zn finger protein HypA/HybF involved in hydrogenase expression